MRRDQLEHAIRTACQIIERPEVIVVGSQAILGSFREDELPADATMSVEVDILPIANSNDETAHLADLIEGVAAGVGEVGDWVRWLREAYVAHRRGGKSIAEAEAVMGLASAKSIAWGKLRWRLGPGRHHLRVAVDAEARFWAVYGRRHRR